MTFVSLRAAKYWQTFRFSKFYFADVFSHISFGLPGLLWTAFELNHCTVYSQESAGCYCANGKCYELARTFKKHQNTCSTNFFFPKN